jgi:hypothetical protein
MRKYHIIYQTVDDVAQDTIHEWAWMLDKLAYPPKPGESYTIFVCEAPGCHDARRHARLWENAFQARISEVARQRDQNKET